MAVPATSYALFVTPTSVAGWIAFADITGPPAIANITISGSAA